MTHTPPVWVQPSSLMGAWPQNDPSILLMQPLGGWEEPGGKRGNRRGWARARGIRESITALNSQQKSENLILHI